jgi:two-component system, OmpR family, sensor histidine kinase KdpD
MTDQSVVVVWPAVIVRCRQRLGGYVAAFGAVTLVSLFIGFVLGQVNLANVSMLYLIAVLATAVVCGRGAAVFASLSAFLIFDWFFVEPLHQLTVSDPEEWVSLLFFLLTATVTGQLAAGQRERAREAQRREREAIVLYDVVRLLGEGKLDEVLGAVAERLRAELQLRALAVEFSVPNGETRRFLAGDAEALAGLQDTAGTTAHVLHRRPSGAADDHATPGRWVRLVHPTRPSRARTDVHLVPVRVGERRVGGLLLIDPSGRFDAAEDRLVSVAAAQIGSAIERARLRENATEAEILRRTDQLRTSLLNAVSHDLRTPLATIMASAGSLRQQDVSWTEEERQGFAQAIEAEADHLNHLVGNLLDLSRIEGGGLRPEKSWQDLEVLIDDVVDRLKPLTRRHRLRVDVPAGLPPVWLDPVEIGEVIYNLVENAVKYTPPLTEIVLQVRHDADAVSISVVDHGPGIPVSALPHLFDPFYRVADGRPRPQGLGLGLAIVKGLVEAHGGRVWAENRAGGGARVTFVLPLSETPAGMNAA